MTRVKRGPTGCGQRSAAPDDLAAVVGDLLPDLMLLTALPDDELIPLTVNEIRRLFATFTRPRHPFRHTKAWSEQRRRRQARAKRSHYKRRLQRLGTGPSP